MIERNIPERCRLVLIAPAGAQPESFARKFGEAIDGGDVASLFLPQYDMDMDCFQAFAEAVLPVARQRGVAVVVAGDSRIAGRVHADGIHVEAGRDELADAIERLQGRMMVGAGGVKTRDAALELGELQPDYLFFGRFGYDLANEPHPRNLALGRWWAEMIEIPCIVLGGMQTVSVEAVAQTGAEFVALSTAVFGGDAGKAVAEANAILDRTARPFTE